MNEQLWAEYEDMVARLANPTEYPLVHAALGIAGEAGEIVDVVKKNYAYKKPIDMAHLEEELGDVMYYIVMMTLFAGISLEDCLRKNIEKLNKRYPTGSYSNQDAIDRADKK